MDVHETGWGESARSRARREEEDGLRENAVDVRP
jgi:hypothetical protein